jgi:hypothetical protein
MTTRTKHHRFRCDACDQSLDKVPLAPMLRDDVWNSVAGPQETLCADCLFERMIRVLDRMPCFADCGRVSSICFTHRIPGLTCFISKEKQPPFSTPNGVKCYQISKRLRKMAKSLKIKDFRVLTRDHPNYGWRASAVYPLAHRSRTY